MSPTKGSRGAGKTRNDTSDPVPVAEKSFRTPVKLETRIAEIDVTEPAETETRAAGVQSANVDLSKNTWTVKMAAAWAGVPERTLYRILRDGLLPCIAMGKKQVQNLSTAKSGKRVRKCYRFVIPRAAFVKAWENLGSAGSIGNTAF
jgi:hypothetical protein